MDSSRDDQHGEDDEADEAGSEGNDDDNPSFEGNITPTSDQTGPDELSCSVTARIRDPATFSFSKPQ